MIQLLHIIRFKFLAYFKSTSKLSFENILKNFGSFIVYSSFAIGAYFFSNRLISYLLVEAKIGQFLLYQFISTALYIFFLSINLGNIIVSYSTLYKSDEVKYLFTKPIHPTKIFLLKFFDNFFYSSSTMIMVLIALLAGYAVYFELGIMKFFTILFFQFVPFIISAGSLGVIFLLLLINLTSKIGAKSIIAILSISYLLAIFLFFEKLSPVKLINEVMKYYPNIDQYFGDKLPYMIKFLPNNWLAESLYWTTNSNIENAFPYFILQISVSIVLFFFALSLGHFWYHKTWLNLSAITRIRKSKTKVPKSNSFFSLEKPSIFNSVFDSIFKKDFFTFVREPSQIIHFIVLTILIIIFSVSVKGIKIIGVNNSFIKTIIYLSLQLFNLLLITTFSLRFVFPLFSLEGKVFWKIKSSPFGIKKYIFYKLIPWFVIILIISQSLSFFTTRIYSYQLTIFSSVIMVFVSVAIILLNFGMGTLYSNFKEKNPIRLSSSQGASITFLLCILFMLFVVVVELLPVNNMFELKLRGIYNINPIQFYYMSILIILLSLLISVGSYFLAIKSIKKDY